MRPRQTPRSIPATARYFRVELERGPFDFKLPIMSASALLVSRIEQIDAVMKQSRGKLPIELQMAAHVGNMAAFIGMCWFHQAMDLDTPTPRASDAAALQAFGEAVAEEFEDLPHPLSLSEIITLYKACKNALIKQVNSITVEAEAMADFFGPSPGASTD